MEHNQRYVNEQQKATSLRLTLATLEHSPKTGKILPASTMTTRTVGVVSCAKSSFSVKADVVGRLASTLAPLTITFDDFPH